MSQNNKRPLPPTAPLDASKRARTDTPGTDKDAIARMIAEKRREIEAKMAAMRNAAPKAAVASSSSSSSSSSSAGTQPDDIKRRMAEIQARMASTMAKGNIPTAISDPLKKGLKMDVHPLFDKSGQVDAASIKAMFAKPNFSTAKANQRVQDKPSTAAGAAKDAKAEEAARMAKVASERARIKAGGLPLEEKEKEVEKEKEKRLELVEPSQDLFDPTKNPYFDPKIAVAMPKHRVAGKRFKFVQQGKFVDMANKMRQTAKLEKLKADIAANAKKSGMAVELDLVSDLCVRREPPPATEWWDAPFLGPDTPYESFTMDAPHLDNILTDLIQHPIPIQPPADLGPPPPKPLMLTKKETKKLRRQRRLEMQKEKQDKIRIGLLPPDQPKVKISNLMRVLGTEAVQDPTKIEAAVRLQMRARQLKHDKYIAEHKLTKEQKRDRTRLKLVENTHVIVEACVFRVDDLRRPQHQFKVDVNANQLFLTGCMLLHAGSNLVVVEGGNRGIKQYKKLMLRRIDWTEGAGDAEEEGEGMAGGAVEDNGEPNKCVLVWEGKIKKRLFNGFNVVQCPTERSIREVLDKVGAMHYWDAAKHYSSELS
ncbi:hypothetical protein HDU98_005990 [Podochytrium sp. JEL0797]|nr:hypothetical protein HDU98_005990 [Podochytrium sp. JEL0797]